MYNRSGYDGLQIKLVLISEKTATNGYEYLEEDNSEY
jgi:hypothetical protein